MSVVIAGFANGQFIVKDGQQFDAVATRDEDDADWKTALARGYKGIKAGDSCRVLSVWDNLYGRWARIEHNGRKFDVRPSALEIKP